MIHKILYLYRKRTIDFSSTIFYGYRKIFDAEKFCGDFQLHEETFVTATLFASRLYFMFFFLSFNNKTFFNLKNYHMLFSFDIIKLVIIIIKLVKIFNFNFLILNKFQMH